MVGDRGDRLGAARQKLLTVDGPDAARESGDERDGLRVLHQPGQRGDLQVGKLELVA